MDNQYHEFKFISSKFNKLILPEILAAELILICIACLTLIPEAIEYTESIIIMTLGVLAGFVALVYPWATFFGRRVRYYNSSIVMDKGYLKFTICKDRSGQFLGGYNEEYVYSVNSLERIEVDKKSIKVWGNISAVIMYNGEVDKENVIEYLQVPNVYSDTEMLQHGGY